MSNNEKKGINKAWEQTQEIILKKYKIIKGLTNNPVVKGTYIESIIRSMIENWVKPYVVSNGVIVLDRELDYQIDSIIWERHRAPAFVEEGNFAAVLPDSVKAIAEIKSFCDSSEIEKLQERLHEIRKKITNYIGVDIIPYSVIVCGIVVRSAGKMAQEIIDKYANDANAPVFVLFREKNGELEVNEGILWKLANFIYTILPTALHRPWMET